MSWKNNRRSGQTLKAFTDILQEQGHDSSRFLDDLGLDIDGLQTASPELASEAEIKIIQQALALLPERAGYGLRVGEMLPLTIFGVWGLAIVTSPNIRQAFETLARYSEASLLLSRVRLIESREHASFVVEMGHLPESIHRFTFERYVAATINFLREVAAGQDFSGFTLQLPFSDQRYAAELAEVSRLEVVSGQSHYAIVADHRFLNIPLPDTNSVLHAQFVAECDQILRRQRELTGHAQSIREYMLQSRQFSPKFEDVASTLCIGERTLRRRLAEVGMSFSQIVLETKMTLAKELLIESSLPVKVVADRLDYSEPASFVRAFKKWWGVSPARIKREAATVVAVAQAPGA